jgi:hypothetical protein
MAETVYYTRHEARFESFPAENYVDYMTNVMPIPERHIFWIPSRGVAIICDVSISGEDCVLRWRLEPLDELPENTQHIKIDNRRITSALNSLVEGKKSIRCPVCEENLGEYVRLF